ncbi:hypothetical protein MNV49_006306 [Pseudohyphozyma bogoriensis]|nr:hypothetical protein MNV49_006306 [Pseudohyphozyma bogoriensis]
MTDTTTKPKKKVYAGFGIDFDAVAIYINTMDGGPVNMSDVSRGVYGAKRGVPRLLKLFEDKNIKATWFVPGHSLETFPDAAAAIRDSGHELAMHAYCHEQVGHLSEDQLVTVLKKAHDTLEKFCGKKPKGWASPHWFNHPKQIEWLEALGVEYDHSYMHDDFTMYWAPKKEEVFPSDYKKEPEGWFKPMNLGEPSNVVEVPCSWLFDDWPPFQFSVIEKAWKENFTFAYEHYDTFVFPITIHPQVSGHPHVLYMHERLIDWINTHEGVEWCTFAEMNDHFRAGQGVSEEQYTPSVMAKSA